MGNGVGVKGSVILVGGGPGDPGLLTLRGREAIETAEVVLFDRLVGEEILALIPTGAEAVDVGKSSGSHPVPQEEINRLILEYVRQGKRVVRLKGGDPYLFGRGAEELEAVVEAGFPFEVVPGVTSAIAVPSYGGIPVSHRHMASSVHIITGHPRHGGESSIDYDGLVKLRGTLVFLMGVGALPELTAGLMAAGMAPETPAALVENGTRPGQRRLCSTVSGIAECAEAEGFGPPSVLVVGEVVSLADRLDWVSRRPLHGRTVAVTRPRSSAGTLAGMLRALGCGVVEYPCIRTEPLPVPEACYRALGGYDWIVFTSPVGAERFFRELAERKIDVRFLAGVKLAAIGVKTAAPILERGILPDYVPDTYNAGSLAAGLLEGGKPGERVLLYRAREGTPALPEALTGGGFAVDDVAAYETLYESPEAGRMRDLLERGAVDAVTFTSASTVRGFARSLPGLALSGVTGVCIGEETAAEARSLGMRVLVSREATIESLTDRVLEEWGNARD